MNGAVLFTGPALRVRQPIGEFWVASIPASILLNVTSADPLRLLGDPSESPSGFDWNLAGELRGTQRKIEVARLKQIATFVNTIEATFPNSIILSVDEASATEDSGSPWTIAQPDPTRSMLTIPQGARKARVVDGQHRLYAFKGATPEVARDFELLCAVFFGLADPMQAFIFATINTNQKPVRRGLAMNLYGYNVEDQGRAEWTPEKLAVFIARRLNFEPDSPLSHRVKIEAEGAPSPRLLPDAKRPIPMAAIVDVALGLISRNPKRDRDELATHSGLLTRAKRNSLHQDKAAPLRDWYLNERDADTYALIKEYFRIIDHELWSDESAILVRAVDIRALGDFLCQLLKGSPLGTLTEVIAAVRAASVTVFAKARNIAFNDPFFEATYRGRRRVEIMLRVLSGENILNQVSPEDRQHFERLLRGPNPH